MTADEFDQERLTPVSPDERHWRHPAEHADAERNKHFTHNPPLGRRLTALTATVSLVASIAILLVAIPKGISEYVDAEISSTTHSIPRVMGSLLPLIATATGANGATTAASLGNGCWVVSAEAVDISEPIWLTDETGADAKVRFITVNADRSLLLLRTSQNAYATPSTNWGAYLTPTTQTDLEGSQVIDRHGPHRITDELVIKLRANSGDIPVMTDTPVDGIAAIVHNPSTLVGVTLSLHQSTWFVTKDMLVTLINQVPHAAP